MHKLILSLGFAALLSAGAAHAFGPAGGAHAAPGETVTPPPAHSPPPQAPLADPSSPPSTPEPLTMGALALGAAGIVAAARLRRRKP
jgi:hypothetical protein